MPLGHKYHQDRTLPAGSGWIFVFGSNLAGRHGAGAAKVARLEFDADYGVGIGPTGRAYAIPTKDASLRTLSLEVIESGVKDFLRYAASQPDLKFFVTRIGCELAGYKDEQIAPLFAGAPVNCSFAKEWRRWIEAPVARSRRFPSLQGV